MSKKKATSKKQATSKKKAGKKKATKKGKAGGAPRKATPQVLLASFGSTSRLDHDDPIIADNANVQIDFTRVPDELSSGTVWGRSYTKFQALEPEFDGVVQKRQPVKGVSSITFTYAKPNNPAKEEELVFTASGNHAIVMSVEVDKFKRKSVVARKFLVASRLSGLRLMKVAGQDPNGDPFTIELFDSNSKPKHGEVRVTILAEPEPHH